VQNSVVVRTQVDPATIIPLLKQQIWAIDKNVPSGEIASVREQLERDLVRPRFNLTLLGAFAVLALVLAAVGLYGVVAFSVSQRTREIGIRMALGAHSMEVQRLILGNGLRLSLAGLALGVVGSLALTKIMSALLYGMSPLDVPTYVAVGAVLVVVTLVACWSPARRAARVDPMVAIRSE
jgi:ABC-type antimicrobial peptide transport system permease subunit